MAFDLEADDNGLYGLCVFNADNVEDDEVQETFGKYGDIISIHRASNLLFIRYQEKEEAASCLKAFKNDLKYNVKPARKKNQGNNNQRSRDSFDRSSRTDTMSRKEINGPRRSQGFQPKEELSFDPKVVPINHADEDEANKPPKQMAKVVVVGNLPYNMHQYNVYDICTKAKGSPLEVRMHQFKKPGYRTCYYAIVLVKTEEEQKKLITGLNHLSLNGYKLTVNTLEQCEKI